MHLSKRKEYVVKRKNNSVIHPHTEVWGFLTYKTLIKKESVQLLKNKLAFFRFKYKINAIASIIGISSKPRDL